MNLIANRVHPRHDRWQPAKARPAAVQDHDLPVLAKEENPTVSLDWEPLLLAGIQPALVVGGERRWHGRR